MRTGRVAVNHIDRYSIHLFADEQDGTYLAVCPEFPGVSAFGDTREEAIAEARIALELAVETYADEGWPLPTPEGVPAAELPSGEFRVRLPRSLHAQLARRAAQEGVSQNQLVMFYLAAGLAKEDALHPVKRSLQRLPAQSVSGVHGSIVANMVITQAETFGDESEFWNWGTQADLAGGPVERDAAARSRNWSN